MHNGQFGDSVSESSSTKEEITKESERVVRAGQQRSSGNMNYLSLCVCDYLMDTALAVAAAAGHRVSGAQAYSYFIFTSSAEHCPRPSDSALSGGCDSSSPLPVVLPGSSSCCRRRKFARRSRCQSKCNQWWWWPTQSGSYRSSCAHYCCCCCCFNSQTA